MSVPLLPVVARRRNEDKLADQQQHPTLLTSTSSRKPSLHWSSSSETTDDQRRIKKRSTCLDRRAFVLERVDAEISTRYDIRKGEIGSGGYGKVFLAEDREVPGRRVAIKKVRVREENVRASFQQEVTIMKDLSHPNICKILETYDEGKHMYLIMELCEGGDLFDHILEHGPIPAHRCAVIVRQVASALKYAHSKGVCHRDLMCEKICFCSKDTADTHVKVIDWGVGFYFGQARMRTGVGSATYMAPEVLDSAGSGVGYTPAVDIWGLGVVTYIATCGEPPFSGTLTEQLDMMRRELAPFDGSPWQQLDDSSSSAADTPDDARSLVQGLLRCDPTQRLSLDDVLSHTWLAVDVDKVDKAVAQRVLSNTQNFRKRRTHTSRFYSLCKASVVQQLDHESLKEVRQVFLQMDTDGDGLLKPTELRDGVERIFGPGSEQLRDVDDMFARLDMDGSGHIDYSEFCAGGIGLDCVNNAEEHALWAAFKAFDIEDNGRITFEEATRVLMASANSGGQSWSRELCENAVREIFSRFDHDKDGSLDFKEWLELLRECADIGESSQDCKEAGQDFAVDSSTEVVAEASSQCSRVGALFSWLS
jgi:calcium-dependent protein kinase